MNKSLYMIFIERNKTDKIRNYIWFYDRIDKIEIIIGLNCNNNIMIEYIPKENIYCLINDIRFQNNYLINYIDIDLMNKLELELKIINQSKFNTCKRVKIEYNL
jgi:hypothetical protein